LPVREWRWKRSPEQQGYGFVAQECEGIIPGFVQEGPDDIGLTVSPTRLIPVLVRAIQEQQEQIDKLEAQLVA